MELTVYSPPSRHEGPAKGPAPGLVLAHGAGAGQASPFMTKVARGMADRGIATATFDFPYMRARRKLPDPPHVLENAWREALDAARSQLPASQIVIGGKSMGGAPSTGGAAGGAKMPDVMTPAEAAQFMKVTESDIMDAINDGSLKAKKVGKAFRISKDNLEAFMNS